MRIDFSFFKLGAKELQHEDIISNNRSRNLVVTWVKVIKG